VLSRLVSLPESYEACVERRRKVELGKGSKSATTPQTAQGLGENVGGRVEYRRLTCTV
jgi:hypothetical protein